MYSYNMKTQEQDVLTLTLPLSPSVNDSYGITYKGKLPIKYVKPKAKEYFKTVETYIKTNGYDIKANIPLKVEIFINFATRHRNDLDNRLKSLFDSLTQAEVWDDDSLIDELHVYRGIIQKPGSIIIKIQEYKQ